MIIEHNKKVKPNNPTPYSSGSKTKPYLTFGMPTSVPQQVHQHSQDESTEASPPDTPTQTLVNKCLAETVIDPTDIQNVMSVSHAKGAFHLMTLQGKYIPIKDMSLQESTNPIITLLTGEPM